MRAENHVALYCLKCALRHWGVFPRITTGIQSVSIGWSDVGDRKSGSREVRAGRLKINRTLWVPHWFWFSAWRTSAGICHSHPGIIQRNCGFSSCYHAFVLVSHLSNSSCPSHPVLSVDLYFFLRKSVTILNWIHDMFLLMPFQFPALRKLMRTDWDGKLRFGDFSRSGPELLFRPIGSTKTDRKSHSASLYR